MRRALFPAPAGLALAACLAAAVPARASNVTAGADAHNIAGTWLNTEVTTLKDLRGMAVLIEFWGTG